MPEQRPAIQLAGTQIRLHYSDHDWSSITGTRVDTPTGQWPAGGNLRAAREAQDAALAAFDEAGRAIIKAKSDGDLNDAAKHRRAQDAADAYFTRVNSAIEKMGQGMATMANAAAETLTSVRQLDAGDTVGELRDQEARAYVRSLEPSERQRLVVAMTKGEHPEVTASVLRGPGLVSGLGADTLASLNRAGVMASYRESIHALRDLLMVRDDVVRTAIAGADALAQVEPTVRPVATRANAWRSDEGADALREWIDAFNLPTAA
ncbi:hypothetical protein [Halomonas sp. HG01]|uniref:hypothetical protein n=1 Tax=Halomonas sp. HG01 TaxID=1609967 RepID=UPI0006145B87|nr:hypothetical protein [Halomonas sp. HG01]